MSDNASLEKSRKALETGGWRGALFMLRCNRIPVMLNLLTTVDQPDSLDPSATHAFRWPEIEPFEPLSTAIYHTAIYH